MSDTLNTNLVANLSFASYDYKGVNSLSSYALPITPLTFVPDIGSSQNTNMVWDFGDGTFAESFSASHYYKFPGTYKVHLIQYDCNSNDAFISTFSKVITIYDYLPLTFTVNTLDFVPDADGNYALTEDGDFILQEDGDFVLLENSLGTLSMLCGQIGQTIKIDAYFPLYQPAIDIYYDIYNSASTNWWDISANKFAHLESFNVFYEKIYNYTLKHSQYSEISKITVTNNPIFVKIFNGTIVPCLSSDGGSCYAGLSGTKECYIKEDNVTPQLLVDLRFDKVHYKNPYIENFNYLNNLGITLSAVVADNIPVRFDITSNGLDGEGYPVDSFNIDPTKFYNTKIPFVVKIKDGFNFTIKNFDTIPLSALVINLYWITDVSLSTDPSAELLLTELGEEILATGITTSLPTSAYSISSLYYQLSSQGTGGSFRGYLYFPKQDFVTTNVKIVVSSTLTNDQGLTYSLTGESNYFNVYPNDYLDMFKKNEDFAASNTLKDLRFQEILIDKHILFDDFFGGILGDENLDHENIGLKLYEGEANFVSNVKDIDVNHVDALNSMGEFMGYNDVYEERYLYPVQVKRLIDLLSIDRIKLFGYKNRFVENFDVRGQTSKTIYGINIGNQLDTSTYMVDASIPIVALEKFSNDYVLLNTYQPVSAVSAFNYPLSSYSDDWGWPLVLPIPFDFIDIEKYYLFFEFVNQFDNTIMDGVIDFNNPYTTIPFETSYSELNDIDGIKEYLFVDTLYTSLSLVN